MAGYCATSQKDASAEVILGDGGARNGRRAERRALGIQCGEREEGRNQMRCHWSERASCQGDLNFI